MVLREPIKIKDKAILKIVFEIYYKALLHYGIRFLHSEQESKDVVQEVFIKLWNKKLEFTNELTLRSYLYTSVKNKCLNKLEQQKVKDNYRKDTMLIENDISRSNQAIYKEEITRQLDAAISQLSSRKRDIIKLSLKGLSNDVIATRLNIKLQTVKTIKSQAYEAIRTYFSNTN
ncbi:sigma-70 family RNA polymerase sigma factor [Flavivirga eckloniae]|uniref:HTH luxR-type domain-containing protein n=1 Tax=Flavivirga eckloniae TaxID=1803846 RepID=A0A2K9PLN2_9FLAO|nr:sigma-70 family RNA polymerase sigma factor [Flavivirga eckloniae]AUP77935.1 hypothetical protein C1H87_04090 [Flavivirga eckloniae]